MNEYTAFFLAACDEFCLRESCLSLLSQGVKNFLFLVPQTYWNGDPVTKEDVESVTVVHNELCTSLSCQSEILRLDPLHFPGKDYEETEAKMRNHCMGLLQQQQQQHVLIVDSDELWRKGALLSLDYFLQRSKVSVATITATPIGGFPGYPIVAKKEGLLVYMRSAERFSNSRSTCTYPAFLDRLGVYHFTSTRRTMKETIRKHIRSTHYGDPLYDFDGWIEKVLPKMKPGLKNCHMFTPWEVWKEVRYFSEAEWNDIPKSLKSYLGGVE